VVTTPGSTIVVGTTGWIGTILGRKTEQRKRPSNSKPISNKMLAIGMVIKIESKAPPWSP